MNKVTAEAIVDRILDDLEGRAGLYKSWYMMTPDEQSEIRRDLIDIVLETANG